jgi:hypothetical protein
MKEDDIIKIETDFSDIFNGSIFLECNSGWFKIIYEALSKIQEHVRELYNAKHIESKEIVVTQIKEKYGTLRIYMSSEDDVIEDIISKAHKKSSKTCEICGKRGKIRGSSWLYTACDTHTKLEDL